MAYYTCSQQTWKKDDHTSFILTRSFKDVCLSIVLSLPGRDEIGINIPIAIDDRLKDCELDSKSGQVRFGHLRDHSHSLPAYRSEDGNWRWDLSFLWKLDIPRIDYVVLSFTDEELRQFIDLLLSVI